MDRRTLLKMIGLAPIAANAEPAIAIRPSVFNDAARQNMCGRFFALYGGFYFYEDKDGIIQKTPSYW